MDKPKHIPTLEECYPVNLLIAVLEVDKETELFSPWNYDIQKFAETVTRLMDREQKIISMRFHHGMTYEQVAKEFGVTRERIRQIERRALRKLSHPNNLNPLGLIKREALAAKDAEIDELRELIAKQGEIIMQYEKFTGKTPAEVTNDRTIYGEQYGASLDRIEDHDICDMELSVRSYNCLKRACINTIGDVIEYDKNPDTEWCKVRNLGRKSVEEIRKRLYEMTGYRLQSI